MNWSGNFREGLAREIRENKTLAKITAYTVVFDFFICCKIIITLWNRWNLYSFKTCNSDIKNSINFTGHWQQIYFVALSICYRLNCKKFFMLYQPCTVLLLFLLPVLHFIIFSFNLIVSSIPSLTSYLPVLVLPVGLSYHLFSFCFFSSSFLFSLCIFPLHFIFVSLVISFPVY